MNECFTLIFCPLKWPKRILLLKQLLLVFGFYPPVALSLCTSICKHRAEHHTVLPLYSYELCGSNIFITTMSTAFCPPQQTWEETEACLVLSGESSDVIYLVSQAWTSFNLFYCNLKDCTRGMFFCHLVHCKSAVWKRWCCASNVVKVWTWRMKVQLNENIWKQQTDKCAWFASRSQRTHYTTK